ncbi:MAG TPA: formate--tetrahydrofolate ligase, partial [Marinilabiliaceae bacterium]|nr:formate--tetrahydrofolate ligase [Marinilabiliaceae bacterium]
DLAVLVATVRALKYHGGVQLSDIKDPNAEAVAAGIENLEKHIENILKFNICPVIAINRFSEDSDEEIEVILERCKQLGVNAAVADVHSRGGKGAEELARVVVEVANACKSNFKPLYDWNWGIE